MATHAESPPSRAIIDRHALAVYSSMAMLAGMKLDVFTPLKDGPLSVETLAEAIGVSPAKLSPLLFVLVTAELLAVSDGLFANTPVADHYLVRGRQSYVGDAHERYSRLWSAMLRTAESVRLGAPQAKLDFATASEKALRVFLREQHPGAMEAGRILASTFSFPRFHHLLDVAGGTGGLAIAACQHCAELQATVVDLPSVTPIAEEFVIEAGLSDRIRVMASDVLARPPEGLFDVAVLRNFIQVLAPDQARRAVHNVARALEPGGSVFIWGRVLDDTRLAPFESVGQNLVFLNQFEGGQCYTENEHREWLAEAGLVEFQRTQRPGGFSIISARKA